MKDLITRLEWANGPDRVLDKAIAKYFHTHRTYGANKSVHSFPEYTFSIDVARTLIYDGDGFMLRYNQVTEGTMRATASILGSNGREDTWQCSAATPALALCIAALRQKVEND